MQSQIVERVCIIYFVTYKPFFFVNKYISLLEDRILNIYNLMSLQSCETFLYSVWCLMVQLAFHSHEVGQPPFRQLRLCCPKYSRSHCSLDNLGSLAHWFDHSSYFVPMVVGDDMFTHVLTLKHCWINMRATLSLYCILINRHYYHLRQILVSKTSRNCH